MISGSMMSKVSRQLARLCLPHSPGVVTWEIGDIVEVFEDFSWKIAVILRAVQGDYYMVRLLGCSAETNIHKLNIKEQWLWLDDKWISMGKSSGACEINPINMLLNSNYYQKTNFQANARTQIETQKSCLDIHKDTRLQEPCKVSSASPKRISLTTYLLWNHLSEMLRKLEQLRRLV